MTAHMSIFNSVVYL